MSGALAERTFVDTYIAFSILMASFIYPVAISWLWGEGWLYRLGLIDFAGTGMVHLLGGVAGLCGTLILGPRVGRFTDHEKELASKHEALDRKSRDTRKRSHQR